MIHLGLQVDYYVDEISNIYVTKGVSDLYPCYISHTDTVHQITNINVKQGVSKKPPTFGKNFGDDVFDILYGLDDNGELTGIGGDDKCGIFICLEMVRNLERCKAAFFVSEEIGCIGSNGADLEFFNDVSFICEYDAPGDHLISEISSGVRLYESNGDFINDLKPEIESAFGNPLIEQSHPFTDVMVLSSKLPICCINISCGYYNMHSEREFVGIDDVERAIQSGLNISKYGYDEKYYFEESSPTYVNDSSDDYYESEKTTWLSDDLVVFDEDNMGIVIEQYESRHHVSLTEREMKKLYTLLKEKYEGAQLNLF